MDDHALNIVRDRVTQDLQDRQTTIAQQLGRIRESFSARGALFSSMTVHACLDALEDEYRVRAKLVWHAFARALAQQGTHLTSALAARIKNLLTQLLDAGSDDLKGHHDETINLMRGVGQWPPIDEMRSAALERIYNEIDYAALSPNGTDAGPTINIYQTYGIVQTGLSSSASMAITLGDSERRELSEALEAIRKLVADSAQIREVHRQEIAAIVEEVRAEIALAEPNGTRIRGLLQGLAGSIQTLAAAPQAYQLLKGAAALLGIALP